MKKLVLTVGIVGLLVQTLQAKEVRSASVLFEQKCQMCHSSSIPKTQQEQKKMVSPSMAFVMKNTVWGIESEEDGISDTKLKEITINFMKDYIYYPDRKKTNCEDISFDKFGVMPSLKGFITEEELDIVLPWVYDRFKPTKVNGKWIEKK